MRNLLVPAVLSVLLIACNKDDSKNTRTKGESIPESLHLSFATPDWNRHIDCTHLDLDPVGLDSSIFYVSATSGSTKETFFFTYPKDSSDLVDPANLKRYSIREYGKHTGPFEFSQKLPVTALSTDWLISMDGNSAAEYNEVVAVKYVESTDKYASFQIKCRYEMNTYVHTNTSNIKRVTGTYHFKIKALRK